jgi:hypothetical protein
VCEREVIGSTQYSIEKVFMLDTEVSKVREEGRYSKYGHNKIRPPHPLIFFLTFKQLEILEVLVCVFDSGFWL